MDKKRRERAGKTVQVNSRAWCSDSNRCENCLGKSEDKKRSTPTAIGKIRSMTESLKVSMASAEGPFAF